MIAEEHCLTTTLPFSYRWFSRGFYYLTLFSLCCYSSSPSMVHYCVIESMSLPSLSWFWCITEVPLALKSNLYCSLDFYTFFLPVWLGQTTVHYEQSKIVLYCLDEISIVISYILGIFSSFFSLSS